MSSSKPILIAGAGSVGQAFAGLLAHCGEPVTLLASKRTAASLRAAGGIRLAGHLDEVITVADPPAQEGTVGLLDEPGQVTEAQGIIFTSKGQDLPGLARSLGHVNTGWALGLQNGVVKNDVLAAVFGESKVLGAATMIIAARQEDGQIALASPAITFVGELSGEKSQRVEDLASRLNRAGITAVIPDDIRSVEWTKACNAAGAFAVAALTRTPMVQMMRNRDYARAFLSLAQEVAAIAAAYGVEVREHQGLTVGGFVTLPLDEAVDAMLEHRSRSGGISLPQHIPPPMPSMQQDLLAGRPMEVEEVFGDLVERARQRGIAVPRLELARDLLRAINAGQKAKAEGQA